MSSETLLVYGGTRDERRALHRKLGDAGFRVLLASSLAEAAKCLASHPVRAIVMADASPHGRGERDLGRSTWSERGIPIIDVANDSDTPATSTADTGLLETVRHALALPHVPSATDQA